MDLRGKVKFLTGGEWFNQHLAIESQPATRCPSFGTIATDLVQIQSRR